MAKSRQFLGVPRGAAHGAAVFVLLAQLACGGKAQSSNDEPAAGTGQGGSTSSSGAAATAGGGSAPEGTPFYLDDTHPWFDAFGNSEFPDQNDEILHLALEQAPAQATFSTHNIIDFLSYVSTLHFSARASAPFRLLVSASHSIKPYDYFAAREPGVVWPITGVDVGTDWQTFDVPLAAMQPPETGDDGVPSFYLAFIVDSPEPIELWLNEVYFE